AGGGQALPVAQGKPVGLAQRLAVVGQSRPQQFDRPAVVVQRGVNGGQPGLRVGRGRVPFSEGAPCDLRRLEGQGQGGLVLLARLVQPRRVARGGGRAGGAPAQRPPRPPPRLLVQRQRRGRVPKRLQHHRQVDQALSVQRVFLTEPFLANRQRLSGQR